MDSGAGVETTIEAQDAIGPGLTHHGHMQGVPCGEAVYRADECSGGADLGHAKGQNVVGNRVKALERSVNGIKPLNRRVAMKYLLVDLHIGDESFPVSHQLG